MDLNPFKSDGLRFYDLALVVLGVYTLLTLIVLPGIRKDRHGAAGSLSDGNGNTLSLPVVTMKYDTIPGDPVNILLAGTLTDVELAMTAAGWTEAVRLGFMTFAHESISIITRRRYDAAPVSTLRLFGRRQDLAFEMPDGKSPGHRHHIRLWRAPVSAPDGRPLWLGAATYDRSVGISRRTGQPTHHIAPDIDSERQAVVASLETAGRIIRTETVPGVGLTLNGRNGEDDRYYTDGNAARIILTPAFQ